MNRPDLLDHVLEETCSDPDCEVHNIDVAMGEEVVNRNQVAFFLAGMEFGRHCGRNTVALGASIKAQARQYLSEGE